MYLFLNNSIIHGHLKCSPKLYVKTSNPPKSPFPKGDFEPPFDKEGQGGFPDARDEAVVAHGRLACEIIRKNERRLKPAAA